MRYFLSRHIPEPSSILLVESGSRGLLESLIPNLRETWSDDIYIDLVTCYAKPPEGFRPENTRIYRVTDYRGREARGRLYRELSQNRYSLVGIVCSGEPLMTKWKWMLALRIPAKVFIINENVDYFWLDRGHLGTLREFCTVTLGFGRCGRRSHSGARVFLPVHVRVSDTLCNDRPCAEGPSQSLIHENYSSQRTRRPREDGIGGSSHAVAGRPPRPTPRCGTTLGPAVTSSSLISNLGSGSVRPAVTRTS